MANITNWKVINCPRSSQRSEKIRLASHLQMISYDTKYTYTFKLPSSASSFFLNQEGTTAATPAGTHHQELSWQGGHECLSKELCKGQGFPQGLILRLEWLLSHAFRKLRWFLPSRRPTFFQRCSVTPAVPITCHKETSATVYNTIEIMHGIRVEKVKDSPLFPAGETSIATNSQASGQGVYFRTYWFPCVVCREKKVPSFTR